MPSLRIASLQPSISITLDQLGALDQIVACTRYCVDVVPELRHRGTQIIHDAWSAETDEILSARSDLVIASVPYRMESLAAILRAGCTVVTFSPRTLADVYRDTLLLGRLVDRGARAQELVTNMQAEIEKVRLTAAGAGTRPRVYCEEWGKPLIHSQPWVAELVDAAGGVFVGTPAATTDADAVAAIDPDVLMFAWCGAGDRVPLERIVESRGWGSLRAVRDGSVYCINDEYLNTPATTLLHGLRAIAGALHPNIFGRTQGLRKINNAHIAETSI